MTRPNLLAALIAGAMFNLVASADARPLGGRDDSADAACPQGAVCGSVMRPLDPSGAVAGQLAIAYRLYTHTGPNKLGVIVAQEGGPGYPTSGSAFEYLLLFGPMRPGYDILMVDARGTGRTAIVCPSVDSHPVRTIGDVGDCGASLGAASVLYGTRLGVQDMKAVLDALNITQFNLYGDSYGTIFSQTFAALYPGMLRSLVLDGTFAAVGQDAFYPHGALTARNGFQAACQRDLYCASLPGNSLSRIHDFVAHIRTAPITGSGPDSEGVMRTVTIDPAMVGSIMVGGSGPIVYRDFDAAIRAFDERGDTAPLLRVAAEVSAGEDPQPPRQFSYGLFAAVSCMDYPQIYNMLSSIPARADERRQALDAERQSNPDIYDPLTIAEFQKVPLDISVLDLCAKWPVQSPPYPPGRPIPLGKTFTTAPTLIINGELDTLTPPGDGDIVAGQFPHAQHIVVANSFHVDAIYDIDNCAQAIVRRFIATLDAGDTSCAQNVKPVRLVPIFPQHAANAIPAVAGSGNTASAADLALVSAAVQTAGDAIARWYVNFSGHGAGLHGGQWSYTGAALSPHFTFDNVKWVDDLAVSGNAVWDGEDGSVRATISYTNPEGENAQLTAVWNDRDHNAVARLSGTIGSRAVRATMPAP